MLCEISLRPKTWIQQLTTKIRKLTVLIHEVSGVQKGWEIDPDEELAHLLAEGHHQLMLSQDEELARQLQEEENRMAKWRKQLVSWLLTKMSLNWHIH